MLARPVGVAAHRPGHQALSARHPFTKQSEHRCDWQISVRRKPSADNARNIARWQHIDLGSDRVAVYSSTSPTLTVAAVSSSVDTHGRMQQRSGADVGKTRTAAVQTGLRIDGWLKVLGRAPICVHRLLTQWHFSKIDRNQYCHG